ncbi:NUDIX domain-containing protein [Rhodomicrobium sp. Az07]|uniref:NUDIX hydrolase n=1 Tax=Rhodomicrobium sp. Az07 TaxID=2839034 RepID=UPI001BEB2E27|nr:NUDIX domain-containing protein [Rhodomicrobium sp. Az07]MBT3071749.1 NUDIX domain-containing protein [Rhodomicrobium sp. Az07]
MQTDEFLDLVDENDIVVASRPRSEIYAENLHNFRVINAFLVNGKGEIWTPRRTAHKRIFPLALDMSVGGHVESGETYDEAFARETLEELRIDIAKVPWRLLAYLSPAPGGVRPRQFMKVYEISGDETPDYNRDDFIESFWLRPREILNRIEAGEAAKGDLSALVTRFYL